MCRATALLGIAVLLPVLAADASADEVRPQPQQAQEQQEEKRIVRIYDIRQLLLERKAQHRDPGHRSDSKNLGPFDGPMAFSRDDEEDAHFVATILQEVAEPLQWFEYGGTARLRWDQGRFIILATEKHHAKIAALLKQLKPVSQPMRIEATWLVLTPEQIRELRQARTPYIIASDELMESADVYARGHIMTVAGQPARLKVKAPQAPVGPRSEIEQLLGIDATQLAILSNDDDDEADEPEPQPGVHLAARVLTSDTGKGFIDVSSYIGELRASTKASSKLEASQAFRTALPIPLNKNVVIGGITMKADADKTEPREIYLVIRVIVDEEQKAEK